MRLVPVSVAVALATAISAPAARADGNHFDSSGWTLLGEQTIDGKRDHDTITVGKSEGLFTSITVFAADGDFQLNNLTVTFGNKETFSPEAKFAFKEGSRTRAIDLPGKQRGISTIDITYTNVGRSRAARVQIWGKEGTTAANPEPAWDSSGWTVLGTARASGKRGTVTIALKGKVKDYERLTFAVNDGDLQITDVDAVYKKGPRGRNKWGGEFKEGVRRAELALAGGRRPMKSLQIKYVNRTPTKRATIQVWGKDLDAGATTNGAWTFDSKGWTLLGEQTVDGKRDRDSIKVGRKEGTFSKMAVVVLDSDLSLDDLAVTFGNKETWTPQLKQVFKEGNRSRELDFPANKRFVDHIDVAYSNLPGGGKARIQIWAK